jgi:hypothetical protein
VKQHKVIHTGRLWPHSKIINKSEKTATKTLAYFAIASGTKVVPCQSNKSEKVYQPAHNSTRHSERLWPYSKILK